MDVEDAITFDREYRKSEKKQREAVLEFEDFMLIERLPMDLANKARHFANIRDIEYARRDSLLLAKFSMRTLLGCEHPEYINADITFRKAYKDSNQKSEDAILELENLRKENLESQKKK